MRFIVVEVLKPERLNTAAVALPKHTLETENDRVRIYRVKIAAGESVPPLTPQVGWKSLSAAQSQARQHGILQGKTSRSTKVKSLK